MSRIKIDSEMDIQKYSQFYDYEEFKTNMEIWLIVHQSEFTLGEVYGLTQLIHLSSEVPGVCHEAMGKIVCCKELGLNEQTISRSTFKRMIWKCMRFGMLKVNETENEYGSQRGNLYIFNPYPTF
ncbi:hypothetical protein E1I69_05270 [Bacillus timonensis]|uniref:Uncharacterized protein n=1 Tax=Bacillus timonensis TaxID=1033734 RepID=A0A4S3PW19_9BACI|nr:hypothetical protein [Bacillus timonensis]THE13918.1 hypothetical protein E1I69_05270 [Bacillus timonensis]